MKMHKIIILTLAVLFFSCTEESSKTNKKDNNNSHKTTAIKTLSVKISDVEKVLGEELSVIVKEEDTTNFDSIEIWVNNKKLSVFTNSEFTFKWNSAENKVGNNIVKAISYHKDKKNTSQKSFDLLSDIKPVEYTYKVVNEYPHDIKAYTQGLYWHDGFLYESTGLKGASTLRKVDLETGSIVQSHIIRNDFFCEGITLYKDRIIQLTWRSNVGFVYNKDDFSLMQKFNYPSEGWGITTIGDSLVMSDGTATLYYLSTQTYTELQRLDVYDNKGPVTYLNELEFINGEIWANVYGKETIVRIDPKTGKVLSKIDFGTILHQTDMHKNIDVFNGIAYDKENNRLFVTGKNWPKLYEVTVFEKK